MITDDQGAVAKEESGTPVEPGVAPINVMGGLPPKLPAPPKPPIPAPPQASVKKPEVSKVSVPLTQTMPQKPPPAGTAKAALPPPSPIDLNMKLPPLSSTPIPMMRQANPLEIERASAPTLAQSLSQKLPLPAKPLIPPSLPPKDAAPQATQWRTSSAPIPEILPTHPEMQRDIARILQEIKLPERRGARSVGDAPAMPTLEPQRIDTRVGQLAKPDPAQAAAEEMLSPEMRSTMGRIRVVGPETAVQRVPQDESGEALPALAAAQGTPAAVGQKEDETDAPIIPSLHTLRDDLQDIVRVKKMSLVHAAALEAEHKQKSEEVSSFEIEMRHRRRARLLRFFATIGTLVFLGSAALSVVALVQGQRTTPQTPQFGASLMFAEQTLGFPLTPERPLVLKDRLASARTQINLTLGAMSRVVPITTVPGAVRGEETERPATTKEFLAAIAPETVPPELIRALDADFFFAIHAVDENVPVLVVPVLAYQSAFASMLAWEKTMNEDLSPIYTRVQYQTIDETGAPVLSHFEDMVIRNYDVRVLKDRTGNIKMLYSFPARDILIIAESPHTFVETLARLRAERKL